MSSSAPSFKGYARQIKIETNIASTCFNLADPAHFLSVDPYRLSTLSERA